MSPRTDDGWRGPRRGADRAVLLAHGAGSDMSAATLVTVADALAERGVPSLRFDYPYRQAGRRAPDRPGVLGGATRDVAAELAHRAGLPPERLVVGGRSMGGRYCSLVVGDEATRLPALGLLLLGYPLHAPGRSDRPRSEHFPRLDLPVLFVSGTRDSMAPRAALEQAARAVPGPVAFHWLETADHGYKPLKSSGRTADEVHEEVARVAADWVVTLP